MRFNNFKLSDDNIGLETQSDGYLDLHNNFELRIIQYDLSTRRLAITWEKSIADYVPQHSFNSFRLEFRNVTVFRTEELDKDTLNDFPDDNVILSQIGLTTKDDIEYSGVLTYVDIKNEDEAVCIYTETKQVFIIYSEEVEFIKNK
jgi:hypothetical protein